LECRDGVLHFQELADEIEALGRIAAALATLEPSTLSNPGTGGDGAPAA
jgi:hypothetical protein